MPGFYPNTFLQPVNGNKNSNLELSFETKSLLVFLVCFSRKTQDRYFILLHHVFTLTGLEYVNL